MGNCCSSRDDDKFYKNIEECIAKNKKFEDRDFPPSHTSLIEDWDSTDADVMNNKEEWSKIEWHRATDIPELNDDEGKLKVFAGKIEPNDIKQGGLGDCYFLSVLSCVAEKERRIKKLFVSKDIVKEGIYAVKMTKNGAKV